MLARGQLYSTKSLWKIRILTIYCVNYANLMLYCCTIHVLVLHISLFMLTLSTQAQEGYCSWVCVCVSVCLSVKSHLTSGASVHPENTVTYSADNEGQTVCGVFSETAPLQRSITPSVEGQYVQSAIFLRKTCMCIMVFTRSKHSCVVQIA